MKTSFYFCLMFLILPLSQSFANKIVIGLPEEEKVIPGSPWGVEKSGIETSLNLKSPSKIFNTNESVYLVFRIKNLSTNTYSLYEYSDLLENEDICFSILSPSGKDISPQSLNKPNGFGSGIGLSVPPNEINGFEFDLKDVCKLDEIGTYKIVLKMKNRNWAGKLVFEVDSNILLVPVEGASE